MLLSRTHLAVQLESQSTSGVLRGADPAVASMVKHMTRLDERTRGNAWFVAEEGNTRSQTPRCACAAAMPACCRTASVVGRYVSGFALFPWTVSVRTAGRERISKAVRWVLMAIEIPR